MNFEDMISGAGEGRSLRRWDTTTIRLIFLTTCSFSRFCFGLRHCGFSDVSSRSLEYRFAYVQDDVTARCVLAAVSNGASSWSFRWDSTDFGLVRGAPPPPPFRYLPSFIFIALGIFLTGATPSRGLPPLVFKSTTSGQCKYSSPPVKCSDSLVAARATLNNPRPFRISKLRLSPIYGGRRRVSTRSWFKPDLRSNESGRSRSPLCHSFSGAPCISSDASVTSGIIQPLHEPPTTRVMLPSELKKWAWASTSLVSISPRIGSPFIKSMDVDLDNLIYVAKYIRISDGFIGAFNVRRMPYLSCLKNLSVGSPSPVLFQSSSSYEERFVLPSSRPLDRDVSSVPLPSGFSNFLIGLSSCVAVSTGPEDAIEAISVVLVDEVWIFTSHYVIIFQLSDFIVKAHLTHSSFVSNSLSSSIEDLSCLANLSVVFYAYFQRGRIIPSLCCIEEV